jgi:hypothetical protein
VVAQSESPQDSVGGKLHRCQLGTNRIKQNSHFENAVVKLQQDQHSTLIYLDGIEAAKCLLQEDLDDENRSNSSEDEGDNDELVMSPCTHAAANKHR